MTTRGGLPVPGVGDVLWVRFRAGIWIGDRYAGVRAERPHRVWCRDEHGVLWTVCGVGLTPDSGVCTVLSADRLPGLVCTPCLLDATPPRALWRMASLTPPPDVPPHVVRALTAAWPPEPHHPTILDTDGPA